MTSTSSPNSRRRLTAIAVLAMVALLATAPFAVFPDKSFDADMGLLLPQDKHLAAEMEFLRDSAVGAVVAVSITAETASGISKLPTIARMFAERIRGAPFVRKVEWRASPKSGAVAIASMLAEYPQVLTQADLEAVEAKLSPDAVERALLERRAELARPGGVFRKGMIASDPLGLRTLATRKLERALFGGGLSVVPSPDALWSRDGRSVLVVLDVSAAPSDSASSRILYRHINEALAAAMPEKGFRAMVVSPHRHAIENERLLKRDIAVTLTVAGIGFFLLFLLFFRTWRAGLVFLTPILGMCCAIGASWLVFSRPSAVILGLGATVIGISLDYGIHVFVSVGGGGNPFDAVRKIIRPLVASALTTLGVFWAFFFSSAPGYHQLAVASTVGIGASLVISVFCLPFVLRGRRRGGARNRLGLGWDAAFAAPSARKGRIVLGVAAVLAALAVAAIWLVQWNFDMRSLDAGGAALLHDEKAFRSIWGVGAPAALVVRAKSLEDALEMQDDFAVFAEKYHLPNFRSLSLVWPSMKTRKANAAAWDAFWSNERERGLRRLLREKGAELSFSPSAFEPFFQSIRKHNFLADVLGAPGFERLAGRYLAKRVTGRRVMVSAYFDDDPADVAKALEFARTRPGVDVVSPRLFGTRLSRLVLRDASGAGIAAIALVLLLAFVCLRSVRLVGLALLPVTAGALAVFPAHLLAGMSLNAMTLVAAIVVAGLAIDYGIFAVTALNRGDPEFSRDAFAALTLSMLTTLVGAGALLWAAHPALRTVGLVVCAGVGAAYAAAVFVVPAALAVAKGRLGRGPGRSSDATDG